MATNPNASAANPLAGLLTGGSSGANTAGNWNTLSEHERRSAWGSINDVFQQILGRSASMAEAKKYYVMGISSYALGQQLMMSKEFVHTSVFAQLKRGYAYELQQFVGGGFKLGNKQVQAFAAHNYTTTDVQAWVYAHPHIYVHSNDYKTRVQQMKDVYQQVFGIDPYAAGNTGSTRQQVDTNKQRAGIQGHQFQNIPNDPLLHHISHAALHFQTPDQYRSFLMNTDAYKVQARSKLAAGQAADAGLTLNSQGRPIQQGLSGIGHQQQADVAQ